MITVGYWCDECRVKYVRHRCKRQTLPCGHLFHAAVEVQCHAFARSGEHVMLLYGRPKDVVVHDVWLFEQRQPKTVYGRGSIALWGTRVTPYRVDRETWEMWVGEWLSSKPDHVIRAFFSRWDSREWVPDWLAFQQHPAAVRSKALVKYTP